MFWSQNKQRVVRYRELANDIKGTASELISSTGTQSMSVLDFNMLHALIKYMDIFLTKCLKDNELTNKHWITARLVEVDMILRVSKNRSIQALLCKINSLQCLVMAGEIKNGNKRNKDSSSD